MKPTEEIENLKKLLSEARRYVEIADKDNWSAEKVLALREEAHRIWKILETIEKRRK